MSVDSQEPGSSETPPTPSPSDLTSSLPAGLAPAAQGPVSPAAAYVLGLGKGSRSTARSVLRRVAGFLADRKEATWEEAAALPWWLLRHAHMRRIRTWLAENYRPRSVNRALSILRGVLTTAWHDHLIDTDSYVRALKVKGVTKDETRAGRALDSREVVQLLRACVELETPRGAMYAAIVAVMYGAGLRRIEVARLDREDVDRDRGTLTARGKRDKRRLIFVPPTLAPFLDAWLAIRGPEPGPLFPRTLAAARK